MKQQKKNLNIKVKNIILIGSAGIVKPLSFYQKNKVRFLKSCKKIIEIKPIKSAFPNLLNKLKNKYGSEDYKNASPIMKQSMVNLINIDLRECLANIKRPTLLIWGVNDTATPISDGELMQKLIPDSGLIRVENCTHYVFLEQPAYVNAVIKNFLTRGDNK